MNQGTLIILIELTDNPNHSWLESRMMPETQLMDWVVDVVPNCFIQGLINCFAAGVRRALII